MEIDHNEVTLQSNSRPQKKKKKKLDDKNYVIILARGTEIILNQFAFNVRIYFQRAWSAIVYATAFQVHWLENSV